MKYTILEKLTALREKLSVRKAGTRLLALLLALVLLQGEIAIPAYSAESDDQEFAIVQNEEQIDRIVFAQDEKIVLSLRDIPAGADLQWQIQLSEEDGSGWSDIVGQVETELTISYALVNNVMDQTGSTAVRCVATLDGVETVTSPVAVQMSFIIENSSSQTTAVAQTYAANDGIMLLADPQYVEIRVEYVDENGNKLFDPYIAYLVAGSEFNAEVNSPVRLGYGAYINDVTPNVQTDGSYTEPNAKTIKFSYTSVTANETITVKYHKIPVPYTVRYLLQNINNDLYTENPAYHFIGKGLEGEYPKKDIEIDIPGFTPLYHQPAEIAADGSTEFEVRYDRNYYLLNFKLDGGYGVEPVYARYETHIVVPTPTKPGYVFNGWDLVSYEEADGTVVTVADGAADVLPATMPHRNETYRAIWKTVNTTYTVAHWVIDDNDNKTFIGSIQAQGTSASSVTAADHLLTTSAILCGKPEHTHTASCIGCGIVEHTHGINCNAEQCQIGYEHNHTVDGTTCSFPCGYNYIHTHGEDCVYSCGHSGHVHTEDCCTVDEHIHGIKCYNPNAGYTEATDKNSGYAVITGIDAPKSGYIYRYNRPYSNDYYNYFYDASNSTWYYLGRNNTYCGLFDGNGTPTNGSDGGYGVFAVTKTIECVIEEHDHTSGCVYCNGGDGHIPTADCCTLTEHTHFVSCYGNVGSQASNVGSNAPNKPSEGEVYQRTNGNKYIYIQGNWYNYSGNTTTGNTAPTICNLTEHSHDGTTCQYCCLPQNPHTDDCQCTLHIHDESCNTCTLQVHTHGEECCSLEEHAHNAICNTCGLVEHAHTDECMADISPYLEWISETNETVTVEGDGSTVLNVYYEYKTYTIRYIYARKNENNYQIATSTSDGQLRNCTWTNIGTSADFLPTFTDPSGKTERSSILIDEDGDGDFATYYYISLSAQFGADITSQWPSAAIGDVTYGNTTHSWGSWGTEYNSGYRLNDPKHANIVGNYPTMSDEMMVPGRDEKLDDGTYLAQNMVAWWGDSNQKIQSHTYHMFFELPPGETEVAGTVYRTYEGKRFKLVESNTFTAAHNGTTRVDPFVYNGFACLNDTRGEENSNLNSSTDYQKNSNNYQNTQTNKDAGRYDCPNSSTPCEYCNCFYYSLNSHTLRFHNINRIVQTLDGIYYSQTLDKLTVNTTVNGIQTTVALENYIPPYPSTYEPNAYTFEGWYTTSECIDGTAVDWEDITMPDSDLEFYAKWTPVTRTVEFFYDHDALNSFEETLTETGEKDTSLYDENNNPQTLYHGEILTTGSVVEPVREGYTFVGWFYIDEVGKKKAFNLYEMEVRKDMRLYAEWHSETRTEYIIYYKVEGSDIQVAAKDQEYIFAGLTKTFTAKAGEELFPDYQGAAADGTMYFPVTNSHSILMHRYEVSEDDNTDVIPEHNIFTFEYKNIPVPDYTVRYVDAQTNLELTDSKTVEGKDHRASVVTEQFVYIEGYLSDAAHKRLIISANESENVITFYYTKITEEPDPDNPVDPDNPDTPPGMTYYKVVYYTQNLDGSTYSEYLSFEEIGEFGVEIEIQPYTTRLISGFTFDHNDPDPDDGTITLAKPEVNEDGVAENYKIEEIHLYYNRNKYPYYVQYLDNATHTKLAEMTVGEELFYGTTLDVIAKNIQNYTLIGSNTKTITINDKVMITDTAGGKVKNYYNVVTFYYQEKRTTITYVPVCVAPNATDFGRVSPSQETSVTPSQVNGSTAIAQPGFKFLGWYGDRECLDLLTEETKYKPELPDDYTENYSFYALFEPIKTELTITKEVTAAANNKNDDTFLFHVKGVVGSVTEHVDLIIPITGNGSVTVTDIYCGPYTVTELTDWSWEYDVSGDATRSITAVETAAQNVVTFQNAYSDPDWLGGEHSVNNEFSGTKPTS